MILSVIDPAGAEILRQNRSILSANITDLINEYGPKAFPDFDGKTQSIFRFLILILRIFINIVDYINHMKLPTPSPSRSSSTSNFSLTHTGSSFNMSSVKLPNFKNKFLDTFQDQYLFNWSYTRPALEREDSSGFLGIGSFFSRSGSTTPTFLSRSSSFSAATVVEDELTSDSIEHVYHIRKDE